MHDLLLGDPGLTGGRQMSLEGALVSARAGGGELDQRARPLVERAALRPQGVTGRIYLAAELGDSDLNVV